MAKVNNPRKKFLFSISFPSHPINPFLCQKVTLPELSIEQVAHGDVNRDVKTAGRVTLSNLIVEKLMTTDGSDTWFWAWLLACQDHIIGGGLVPSQYWVTMVVNELAEDGKTIVSYNRLFHCHLSFLFSFELIRETCVPYLIFTLFLRMFLEMAFAVF